ncbi:MAG: glycosyltransferase [Clostridia bacterium]|nr:glycosyltransferase [Clostridia bacterium]
MKQLNPAPSFWINRLITRKWIRRHFAESALVYTMTDLQKQEYEALLKRPMKILCKAAEFSAPEKREGDTVRLIYAGGLYLNRWKMLSKLAEAVAEINRTETKAELHIYSGSKLKSRQSQKLDDGKNSFLHDGIPYRELMERYRKSDIAVHTESFDLKNRLITRLSFSTKIIDCMSSGCAILAIGPCTQAGISYLKENDAAVCVDNTEDLYGAVGKLVEDRMLIWTYADKAYRLGMRNHCRENIEKSVRRDFCDVIAEYGKDIKQRAERL